MAIKIQNRRGTAIEWTNADPTLSAGEIGFETDTGWFKIGDGSTAWSNLPYFQDVDQIETNIDLGATSPILVDTAPTGPGLAISFDQDAEDAHNDARYISLSGTTATTATLLAPLPTDVPLTVKGEVSQSANLQNWVNNADTVVGSIDNTGVVNATQIKLNNTNTSATASTGVIVGAGADSQHIGISYTGISSVIDSTSDPVVYGALNLQTGGGDVNIATAGGTVEIGKTTSPSVSITSVATTVDGTTTNIGTTAATSVNIGRLVSSINLGGKFGYQSGLGIGGTATQSSSRTASVTLNKLSGQITLFSATTTAGQLSVFTLTNSTIDPGDNVVINHISGGTAGQYMVWASNITDSGCSISVYTPAAQGTAAAPVLQFAVIKGTTT